MQYSYVARNRSGEKIAGVMDAESEAAVLRALDEKRLFPVAVNAADTPNRRLARSPRVRATEIGVFYGQLADLLSSGVPLLRSLKTLALATVNPAFKAVITDLHDRVADGAAFTESLREHPRLFPALHSAMIQAGERAGFLEQVLESLAGFIERLDELRSRVLGALIYPALLVTLGTVVLTVALTVFVPMYRPLLERARQPLPTRVLFGASDLMRDYWPGVLLALAAGVIVLVGMYRSPQWRRRLERWRFKLPVAGTAQRMVAITRFCRILGTMLHNGVPLLQALAISKDATGSALLAESIEKATENVRAGAPLAGPLGASGLFPPQVLAMIAVAEESNQLEKVLVQIADTVERRTNRQVDQAVRLVEPLILILVAGGIAFMALGLLLPIFNMASALHGG